MEFFVMLRGASAEDTDIYFCRERPQIKVTVVETELPREGSEIYDHSQKYDKVRFLQFVPQNGPVSMVGRTVRTPMENVLAFGESA